MGLSIQHLGKETPTVHVYYTCPPDAFGRTVAGIVERDSIGRWGLSAVTYAEDGSIKAVRQDYLSAPSELRAHQVAMLLGWKRR